MCVFLSEWHLRSQVDLLKLEPSCLWAKVAEYQTELTCEHPLLVQQLVQTNSIPTRVLLTFTPFLSLRYDEMDFLIKLSMSWLLENTGAPNTLNLKWAWVFREISSDYPLLLPVTHLVPFCP